MSSTPRSVLKGRRPGEATVIPRPSVEVDVLVVREIGEDLFRSLLADIFDETVYELAEECGPDPEVDALDPAVRDEDIDIPFL